LARATARGLARATARRQMVDSLVAGTAGLWEGSLAAGTEEAGEQAESLAAGTAGSMAGA